MCPRHTRYEQDCTWCQSLMQIARLEHELGIGEPSDPLPVLTRAPRPGSRSAYQAAMVRLGIRGLVDDEDTDWDYNEAVLAEYGLE